MKSEPRGEDNSPLIGIDNVSFAYLGDRQQVYNMSSSFANFRTKCMPIKWTFLMVIFADYCGFRRSTPPSLFLIYAVAAPQRD
jgi:hypothetical protein